MNNGEPVPVHQHHKQDEHRKRLLAAAAPLLIIPAVPHTQMLLGGVHHALPAGCNEAEERALAHIKSEMFWDHGVHRLWLSPLPAHFSPHERHVVFDLGHTRTGLHEYGHSTMLRNSLVGALRRGNMHLYGNALRATRGMKGMLIPAVIAQTGDGKDAGKRGAIAGAVVSAPFLIEEGMANAMAVKKILAVNHIHGILPSVAYLARMAPAYGTYAAAAGKLIAAGYGAGKLREAWIKNRDAHKKHRGGERNERNSR